MSDYTKQPSPESVIAEPGPPLDYRRIEVVDPQMAVVLRARTTTQRVHMMLDANETMRLLIAARLRTENPVWNSEAIECEVSRRMLNAHLHSG